MYDPRIAELFCAHAASHLGRLQYVPVWDSVLAIEPEPVRELTPPELDTICETIADFVDVRSTFTLGHSRGVATLAESAGRRLGMSAAETIALRRSGLVHDLGRVDVPVTVWDKPVALTPAEWQRIQRHPSVTELVLARSAALGPFGTIAGLHHERLDGSGYRQAPASFMPLAARILAVADAYKTKRESRPYRAAFGSEEAAHWLRSQTAQGGLDATAVDAVLKMAEETRPRRRADWPADLTEREVEVLRLVVRGLSKREIGDVLVISPKTVGHHIEHIYHKLGVSTRVAATLFALQHGLADVAA